MTEDEAKTKWCPMVRVASGPYVPGTYSVGMLDNQEAKCIGSACMMWRYLNPDVGVTKQTDGTGNAHGYCGLAGKP